jgi:hypothetical protein
MSICRIKPAAMALALAAPAKADEITLGLGWDGIDSSRHAAAAASLDYRVDLGLALGPVRVEPVLAAQVDTDGDVWAGVGVFAFLDTGFHGLRIEASAAPGVYARSAGQDLGGVFEIRTTLGVSVIVAEGWRLGVMGAHLSNSRVHESNPGTEQIMATVARSF